MSRTTTPVVVVVLCVLANSVFSYRHQGQGGLLRGAYFRNPSDGYPQIGSARYPEYKQPYQHNYIVPTPSSLSQGFGGYPSGGSGIQVGGPALQLGGPAIQAGGPGLQLGGPAVQAGGPALQSDWYPPGGGQNPQSPCPQVFQYIQGPAGAINIQYTGPPTPIYVLEVNMTVNDEVAPGDGVNLTLQSNGQEVVHQKLFKYYVGFPRTRRGNVPFVTSIIFNGAQLCSGPHPPIVPDLPQASMWTRSILNITTSTPGQPGGGWPPPPPWEGPGYPGSGYPGSGYPGSGYPGPGGNSGGGYPGPGGNSGGGYPGQGGNLGGWDWGLTGQQAQQAQQRSIQNSSSGVLRSNLESGFEVADPREDK